MHVAMIGTGYVGLVSAACFSEFGVNVVCVDKVQEKIDVLKPEKSQFSSPAWRISSGIMSLPAG